MRTLAVVAVSALLMVLARAERAPTPPPTNPVNGPVIGILTQDLGEDDPRAPLGAAQPYIAASYVKYLESAGARVVPLLHNSTAQQLTDKFSKINGLLFPGGGADLRNLSDPFMVAATHLFQLAMKENAAGGYFPMWGTCLGFQTLSVLVGGPSVLDSGFDSENLPLPLDYTSKASSSRLFQSIPAGMMSLLAKANLTMNNHQDGVTPSTFASSPLLSSFFDLLSTNMDREGRVFGSTMEAKSAPVYGTQWHPEKNCFEWTPTENIPHSSDAIAVCQAMSNFFVNEARKSNHTYAFSDLMNDVIWNYSPVFSGKQGSGFDQIYLF